MIIKNTAVVIALCTLVGCAHNPTAGEKMLTHSESTKVLGQQWIDSHQSIADAQKRRKEGEAQMKKGYKEIKKGQELVSTGEKNVTAGRVLIDESVRTIRDGQALKDSSESRFNQYVTPTQ